MIRIETFGEYNRVVLLGERRNAFSRQLIERLSGVDCDKDLVITNEGPVFSAGLDLSVFLQSKDAVLEYLFSVHRLVKRLSVVGAALWFTCWGTCMDSAWSFCTSPTTSWRRGKT